MAVRPVVSVGPDVLVLSLVVDDVSGSVTGWQVQNNTAGPAAVTLTSGAFSVTQSFPAGLSSGSVPNGRRWTFGADVGVSYSLTATWSG
ncbi:MAG: hypothetical protein ACXV3F_00345 [Frankiaceae bacterium]